MADILGSIRMVTFNYAPDGYNLCDGTSLIKAEYSELFNLLGYTWGGSGGTFSLPDLRSRVPIGQGTGAGLTPFNMGDTGGAETATLTKDNMPAHTHLTTGMKIPIPANNGILNNTNGPVGNYLSFNINMDPIYGTPSNGKMSNSASVSTTYPSGTSIIPQPVNIMNTYLGINYLICTQGGDLPPMQPQPGGAQPPDTQDDYFIGEIILAAFNFDLQGFYICNGQQLNRYANAALFDLIGYTYGGSGNVFNLPDLTNVQLVGAGQGTNLMNIPLGSRGGNNAVTLQLNNLPAHRHGFTMNIAATSGTGTTDDPTSAFPAAYTAAEAAYLTNAVTDGYMGGFNPSVICATSRAGNNMPLDIHNPAIALNFLICNNGLFPPRPQ